MSVDTTPTLACDHLALIIHCQAYANVDDDGSAPWSSRLYHLLPNPHQGYTLPLPTVCPSARVRAPSAVLSSLENLGLAAQRVFGDCSAFRTVMQRQRSGGSPTQWLPGPLLLTLLP